MSVFRTGLILLAFGWVLGAANQATRVFRAGERAHRAGDSFQAYQLYSRAAALDPSNADYALHRNLLRDWAALAAQVSAGGDDADLAADRITIEGLSPSEVIAGRLALPPASLKGSAEK